MKNKLFTATGNCSDSESYSRDSEYIESLIAPWYKEYSACFALCSMFGWDFREKSKDYLVAFISTQKMHGITIDQLTEWVSLADRETIHGTIPLPDFSVLAQDSSDN